MSVDFAAKLLAAGVEPCDDGTQNHAWRHIDAMCDSCGDHDALFCDTCCDALQQPEHPDLYDELVRAYSISETP